MIALWLPLWSLIGPDEGFVFLIVVFTFFITISLIVKFRSQSDTSCTKMQRHYVTQESMALAQNPFQFRLSVLKDEEKNDEVDNDLKNKETADQNSGKETDQDANKSTDKTNVKNVDGQTDNQSTSTSQLNDDQNIDDFKKGVKIDIFCKIDYYLCYYWGVNIDQFHNFMRLNSQSFNDRIFDGSLFEQNYLEKNEPKLINGSNQVQTIKLTCSDKVNAETLGQSPRTCYPLVVILALDLSKNDNKNDNDVVFMISVIHVKDKVCPLETNVITRLLKKRNGLTINLQTLYTPNEFDESTGTNTAICVICQESLVSIALLPCKHTCTCLECFTKIDKCPLCRSFIRSYFMLKIGNETNNQTEQNNLNNGQNASNNESTSSTTNEPTTSSNNNNRNFFKKVGSKITNLFR